MTVDKIHRKCKGIVHTEQDNKGDFWCPTCAMAVSPASTYADSKVSPQGTVGLVGARHPLVGGF